MKRFYSVADLVFENGLYQLVLDDRPARTPLKKKLALASLPLAQAIRDEWDQQTDTIKPQTMPLTKLVNSALDVVAENRSSIIETLVKYSESDLIFYRASEPEELGDQQRNAWDPVLLWAQETLSTSFVLTKNINFQQQPEHSVKTIRQFFETIDNSILLAALHLMITATGSVLISLAAYKGLLSEDQAWEAAHIDEYYQRARWGEDAEALAFEKERRTDFQSGLTCINLTRS